MYIMEQKSISKEWLRTRMMISRDARIQKNVNKILDGIKLAAAQEQTEHSIYIVHKHYPHFMIDSTLIDEDIADEVLTQIQPLLGDIEIQKIDNRVVCRW